MGCMKVAAACSEAAIDAGARCGHQSVCVEIQRFASGYCEWWMAENGVFGGCGASKISDRIRPILIGSLKLMSMFSCCHVGNFSIRIKYSFCQRSTH